MPADPTKKVNKSRRMKTDAKDIGHVAPDFDDRKHFNTLVVRPDYRISLKLGNFEELFANDPGNGAGRRERMQVLGLFYFPLNHSRAAAAFDGTPAGGGRQAVPGAWEHYKNRILNNASDDQADEDIQNRLKNWIVAGGKLPAPAEDADNPADANFAKIRLPGTYTFMNSLIGTVDANNDASYPFGFGDNTYDFETKFLDDNPALHKIPIVATVEKRDPGSGQWKPAKNAQVYFQLVKPYDLPDFDAATAVDEQFTRPPMRESTVGGAGGGDPAGAQRNNGAGTKHLDDVQNNRNPDALADDDPQRHNAPKDRGGKAGEGNANDNTDVADVIFSCQSFDGFNTKTARSDHEAFEVPVKADVDGDSHKHAVKAKTNKKGLAGVLLTPSRCGGDRYRIRAYLGPDTLENDGEGMMAVMAETGTLVVWRSVRFSRYLRQAPGAPHNDLVTQAVAATTGYAAPYKVTDADTYLKQAFLNKPVPPPNGALQSVGLATADFDMGYRAINGAGGSFDRVGAQFARAFCEVEFDRAFQTPETLTEDEWNRARQQARREAAGAMAGLGLNLDLDRLMFLEGGSPVTLANSVTHLPMRSLQAYSDLLPAHDPKRFSNHGGSAGNTKARAVRLWQLHMLPGFFRELARDGFMPGLTVIQGAYGSSWQLTHEAGNFSGMAQHFRGAYVWAGQGAYPTQITVPPTGWPNGPWQSYDYTSNTLHEMGHCLSRVHAPGANPGKNAGGGNDPNRHDPIDKSICVMSYKACEGQFCAKCLFAFRGWNIVGW